MSELLCYLRYLFSRRERSMRAACVAIDLAHSMTDKDLRDIADYYRAIVENRAVKK